MSGSNATETGKYISKNIWRTPFLLSGHRYSKFLTFSAFIFSNIGHVNHTLLINARFILETVPI